MILLCVDSATWHESVALVDGAELLAERTVRRKRGHGPGILDDVDGLLADAGLTLAQVDGFACGLGPGSFTGLRIALATAKGLAMATGKPIFGARTTDLLRAALPGQPVTAVLDARRGQIYVDGPGLPGPVCVDPARAPLGEGPVILLGDGALKYADALRAVNPQAVVPAEPTLHLPRAARLASMGLRPAPLATLEPVYVRPSDAELNYPDGFPDATVVPIQRHPRQG